MKAYAMNTVGVNKPSEYLDFGDTFLDEAHLRASFDGKVVVDGRETMEETGDNDKSRCNYKIRCKEETADDKSYSVIEAASLPFPQGVAGNPIRFTPLQVESIRSGLSPGLTLVVGPPGTGKFSLVSISYCCKLSSPCDYRKDRCCCANYSKFVSFLSNPEDNHYHPFKRRIK